MGVNWKTIKSTFRQSEMKREEDGGNKKSLDDKIFIEKEM